MAVTKNDLEEIIKVTMQDCPLPPVVSLLHCATEEDIDIIITFIKKYYSKKQIKNGANEYLEDIKLAQRLFGRKK